MLDTLLLGAAFLVALKNFKQVKKMKITDLWSRAGKTFVQAFFGVLIPEVVLILTNVMEYDWSNWISWGLPIITGALAAGISAAWNTIINKRGDSE